MPRELTMVGTVPVDLHELIEAAAEVDGSLVPRVIWSGWALQLLDADDVAVLTVEVSRRVDEPSDLVALLGAELLDPRAAGAGLGGTGPAETWLTESTAPWGPRGATGVRVARALAARLRARISVQEGL